MSKLTVEFSDELSQVLSELSNKKGVSKVDVLRRAIALYNYVEKQVTADPEKRVSITREGKPVTDIVLT